MSRTLVSELPLRSNITAINVAPVKSNKPKIFISKASFLLIALLSGTSVYGYSYINKPTIPVACIETIYVLEAGQSATCSDPRSRIDIISNSYSDVAFMCKCNK